MKSFIACFADSNLEQPTILKIPESALYPSQLSAIGATMTYYYTKNILLVQKLLGHKRIQNTMKYTQLVHFKEDEFDVATATTVEEAKDLLAIGFDHITEKNGVMLFRKPKMFKG
jgi:predicted ATPase